MAKTLSEDLRSRLIMAVDGGMSRRGAAERFGVAASTAVRWVSEWRSTGTMRAKPKGGDRRSHRVEAHGAFLLSVVGKTVDISLVELAGKFLAERGEKASSSTMWRFLDRHDMTVKKSPRTPKSRRGRT
jgi:transposase